MGFWQRFKKSEDQLLKTMLEKYRLNLLSIPRENASVGDLYVQEGNSQYVSTPGSIVNFLEGKFEIPSVKIGETMADVAGTASRNASEKAGLDFLEGFLNALGPAGIGTKVRVNFESTSKNNITFKFENPTRDYLDPGELGKQLRGQTLMKDNALIAEGRRYYIVTAVARSTGISINSEGDTNLALDAEGKIMGLANVDGNISIEKNQTGAITFKGQKNLAFGVELYELKYIQSDDSKGKFQMNIQVSPLAARGVKDGEEEQSKLQSVLLGNDDDATITVKNM